MMKSKSRLRWSAKRLDLKTLFRYEMHESTKFFISDQFPKGSTLLQTFLHRAISAELKSGLDAVKYLYRNRSISKAFALELALYCLRRVGRGKSFCAMQIAEMINQKEKMNHA